MKYLKYIVIIAIWASICFFSALQKPVWADEKVIDFIIKASPGSQIWEIPEDFIKTGNAENQDQVHEGYIDGFKIICRSKGGVIKSLHAQKQFNTGDMSAEHTYYNILGGALAKLLKKYNGTLVDEKGRGESADKAPYDYGEYCYYMALRGSGKTIKSKKYQLGFWYDLGVWKRCDNYGYNSSNPGNVIIEFRANN